MTTTGVADAVLVASKFVKEEVTTTGELAAPKLDDSTGATDSTAGDEAMVGTAGTEVRVVEEDEPETDTIVGKESMPLEVAADMPSIALVVAAPEIAVPVTEPEREVKEDTAEMEVIGETVEGASTVIVVAATVTVTVTVGLWTVPERIGFSTVTALEGTRAREVVAVKAGGEDVSEGVTVVASMVEEVDGSSGTSVLEIS